MVFVIKQEKIPEPEIVSMKTGSNVGIMTPDRKSFDIEIPKVVKSTVFRKKKPNRAHVNREMKWAITQSTHKITPKMLKSRLENMADADDILENLDKMKINRKKKSAKPKSKRKTKGCGCK